VTPKVICAGRCTTWPRTAGGGGGGGAGLRRLRGGAASGPAETELVDLRDALVRLMLKLPARQRTVLVLRYWEGLTEAEVAGQLGCSVGNVKSAASRGMARLRELHGSAGAPEHFVPAREGIS
jgi:hypothetical protein